MQLPVTHGTNADDAVRSSTKAERRWRATLLLLAGARTDVERPQRYEERGEGVLARSAAELSAGDVPARRERADAHE